MRNPCAPMSVLALSFLTACGGGSMSRAAAIAQMASATPTVASTSISPDQADDTSPSTAPPLGGPGDPGTIFWGDPCNPHLFLRSEEISRRVNRHFYKFLFYVERAIASDPTLVTGSSAEWDRSRDGIDSKLTVDKTGDTTFTWTLDLKKTADTTFTTVATGTLDTAGAGGPHQGKGTMNLDLGALSSVTGEEVAGTIAVAFESFTDHRLVSVQATGVVWDSDAEMGSLAATPRNSAYVFFREAGKGGSLKVQEDVGFGCAMGATRGDTIPVDPTVMLAQLELVHRWYLTTDGSVHGRADGQLTGSRLTAAGVAKIEGLTCVQGATAPMTPSERAWLLKAEDSSGATLWSLPATPDTSACDPALNPPDGAVPSAADAKTDFDFSSIVFGDGVPYPFPGM